MLCLATGMRFDMYIKPRSLFFIYITMKLLFILKGPRAGRCSANRNSRGGDHVHPAVPMAPRPGLRASQPGLTDGHLRRGRHQHRHSRLRDSEREPRDGRRGSRARHRGGPRRATRTRPGTVSRSSGRTRWSWRHLPDHS